MVPKSSVESVSETTLPPWVVTPMNLEVVPTNSAFATPNPPSVCIDPVVPEVESVTSSMLNIPEPVIAVADTVPGNTAAAPIRVAETTSLPPTLVVSTNLQ